MTLHIDDLLDVNELNNEITLGYVKVQKHHELLLSIYNYTPKAQYDNRWNSVTKKTRGLILDSEGFVVARPFDKFFNHNDLVNISGGWKDDHQIEVTDKVDGCWLRHTALNLWSGGTITIGEIVKKKLSVDLVGLDASGNLVPATVTGWHNNGTKDLWMDITTEAKVSRYTGPAKLRVTINHEMFVNGEYVLAKDVQPGDTMVTQSFEPSAEAVRLIRASLLGDGCLTASKTRPAQSKYQEPHKYDHREYVYAVRKALGDCEVSRSDTISGFGTKMVWAGARESERLGALRDEWYPDDKKIVPQDLSWMDDFAVAKWLMDDGSLAHSPLQEDRLLFSTHGFTPEDITRLGEKLVEMYGVSFSLSVDKRGKGVALRINAGRDGSINNLWAAVAPHVHPVMRYKLPEKYRNVSYVEMDVAHEERVTKEVKVISVQEVEATKKNFPHGRVGFDVTTTTGNYMARGVIVHNSLGILYPHPGQPTGFAIATRGSFHSVQAEHATAWLQKNYNPNTGAFLPGSTYLFEIVYPQNRIVVDYGQDDALYLIGVRDTQTGTLFSIRDRQISIQRTSILEYSSFGEFLRKYRPPKGVEGCVVRNVVTGEQLKFKTEEYCALHKIVYGLNAVTVWEALQGNNGEFESLRASLPLGSIQDWAVQEASRLMNLYSEIWITVREAFRDVSDSMGEAPGAPDDYREWRKAVAGFVIKEYSGVQQYLFGLLDGKDISGMIWKNVKPRGDWKPGLENSDD